MGAAESTSRDGYYRGNFTQLLTLGSGGQGRVEKVRHLDDGKLYALKMMKLDMKNITYATREIDNLRKLNNLVDPEDSFVVKYYDAWIEKNNAGDTWVYIQMELCEGGTLLDLIKQGGQNVNLMLKMCKEIAAAIEFMHRNGFVHRDIKPHNIFMTTNGSAKIGDYGLAKCDPEGLEFSQMQYKTTFGTPRYTAPEVLTGNYTKKCDVFSMGKVFQDLTSKLQKDSLPDLQKLIEKMVTFDPAKRPSSKEVMVEISESKSFLQVAARGAGSFLATGVQGALGIASNIRRSVSPRRPSNTCT